MADKNLIEKPISSKEIFDGKILHVVHDTVELPNGAEAFREVIRHTGAVCVIPVTEDGMVIMERQYRYPIARVMLEIPAGKLEIGEDPLEGGLRELEEETGIVAGKMTCLGELLPAPAYCDEKITMYLATELTRKERHLDEDEFLDVFEMPLSELVRMVMDGEIADAKTQITVLKADRLLNGKQ